MMPAPVAVITIARGRHDHLALQYRALADSERRPDHLVLVTMGDAELAHDPPRVHGRAPDVVELRSDDAELPLAAARNAGARHAIAAGASVLVFLDVDCVPSPTLVGAYGSVAGSHPDALLCGAVAYLPPPPEGGYRLPELATLADPHPARPSPAPGAVLPETRYELFWSLSFAVTADCWRRIGGFHESYVGYGGEDTDFAMTARERGVALYWVGGAMAFHQHHPVESPPVQHLDAIIRNAALYRSRWGRWPMTGWLRAFADAGLVDWTADSLTRRHAASA